MSFSSLFRCVLKNKQQNQVKKEKWLELNHEHQHHCGGKWVECKQFIEGEIEIDIPFYVELNWRFGATIIIMQNAIL